jgi:hypothetical protein
MRLVLFLRGKIYRTPEDIENTTVYMPASYDAQFMIQSFWIALFQISDMPNAQSGQITSDASAHTGDRQQVVDRFAHKKG